MEINPDYIPLQFHLQCYNCARGVGDEHPEGQVNFTLIPQVIFVPEATENIKNIHEPAQMQSHVSIFVRGQVPDLLLCPDGFFGRLFVTSFTCPTEGKAGASVQYTPMPRCLMGIVAFHWTSIFVTGQVPDLLLCPDGLFG